jgi:hypothetical protein
MFGAKKFGHKLATWFEERAAAYKQSAGTPGLDREAAHNLGIVALALEEVAGGIRAVTNAEPEG